MIDKKEYNQKYQAERAKSLHALGKCSQCGNDNNTKQWWCATCTNRRKETYRLLRVDRKSKGLCPTCGRKTTGHVYCSICLNREKGYGKERYLRRSKNPKYKQYCKKHNKDIIRSLRFKVFSHYGLACKCCGDAHLDLLTLDHINDDGNIQREQSGTAGGYRFYKWVIANNYPTDLQTLCFSCNQGKKMSKTGQCPAHEEHSHIRGIRETLRWNRTVGDIINTGNKSIKENQ